MPLLQAGLFLIFNFLFFWGGGWGGFELCSPRRSRPGCEAGGCPGGGSRAPREPLSILGGWQRAAGRVQVGCVRPSVRPSRGGLEPPRPPSAAALTPPSASFHKASRGGGGEDESGLQAPGDRAGGEGGTWWGFVAGQPPP